MSSDFQTCTLPQLVKQITQAGQRNFVGNLQKMHAPFSKALALLTLRINGAKGAFRAEWHTVQNRLSVVNEVASVLGKNLMHTPNYRFYPLREMFLVGRLFLQGKADSGIEEQDSILGILLRLNKLNEYLEPNEARELMLATNSVEYVLEAFADHFQNSADQGLFNQQDSVELLANGKTVDFFLTSYATTLLKERWRQLDLFEF
jgi:hypothetical protein